MSKGASKGPAAACAAAEKQPDGKAGSADPSCPTPPPSKNCPTDFSVDSHGGILMLGGKELTLSAKNPEGVSGGTFKWKTSCPNLHLTSDRGRSITVRGIGKVSSGRNAETVEVTRTAPGCTPITKTVKLTVARLTFSKSKYNSYGYDDYDLKRPWFMGTQLHHLSVREDGVSWVHVKIEGGLLGTDFIFSCQQGAKRPCTFKGGGVGSATLDLQILAGEARRRPQILRATCIAPSRVIFGEIALPVYKERTVKVVVGKFDNPGAFVDGLEIDHPILTPLDVAAHTGAVNGYMKEAVVKFEMHNLFTDNSVAKYAFSSGGPTLTYDIAATDSGPDVRGIRRILTGRVRTGAQRTRVGGDVVRVAIVPDMKSYYYLSRAAKKEATTVHIRGGHVFFEAGDTPPIGLDPTHNPLNILSVNGGVLTCSPLEHDYPAGTPVEFPAAGWSGDPIIIALGSASAETALWTVPHEVSHTKFDLSDIDDATNVMHHSQDNSDYRIRHSPRKLHYEPGQTEKQWDMMHGG